MDTRRPKRPTTLALFPPRAQPRSQDTINNNSLSKKERKDGRSASPRITGESAQPGSSRSQRTGGERVLLGGRRSAPKPPGPPGAGGGRTKTDSHTPAGAAADAQARPQGDRSKSNSSSGLSSYPRRGGGAGGAGRGGSGREKGPSAAASRGRGGGGGGGGGRGAGAGRGAGGEGEVAKRGGRLCEGRLRNVTQQAAAGAPRVKAQKVEDKGKAPSRTTDRGKRSGGAAGGGGTVNNLLTSQNICVASMVVPRTPVVPRKQRPKDPERTQDKTGSHNNRGSQNKRQRQQEEQRRREATVQNDVRNQSSPTALSRSNSESGSNRMSISSDIEGPVSDPLCPAAPPDRTNTDIREEDGEGDAASSAGALNGNLEPEPEREAGPFRKDAKSHHAGTGWDNSAAAATAKDPTATPHAAPKVEGSAGLTDNCVKYNLSSDEHARLELDLATELAKGRKDDDSDTETVYQSANEEEDPEYEEERTRLEREKRQEQRIEERKRREQQNTRREEVVKLIRQSKMAAVAKCAEEPGGVRSRAPATRKFLNLFVNGNQYKSTGAESFGVFSCFLDGVEKQQSHRAVYRFVPRHADELYLETDDPVLMLSQSEDLWCQGYNMRTGSTGIFPTYYAVRVSKEPIKAATDAWMDGFPVRFLGSVQVPFHQGNHVLCAAMQKVACNRRISMQPPPACDLEVSVSGLKISAQDKCSSSTRGDQCSHFFQLKNISFCGCHPKHNKYFGFISKHPDQQRFACHVVMSDKTALPLAQSVGRAFQQYYAEHIGYSCPTEDIFID